MFAIAEDAYTAMRKEGMGQTIIVSGERYANTFILSSPFSSSHSGAGKTESVSMITRLWHWTETINAAIGKIHHALSRLRESPGFKLEIKIQVHLGRV